MAGINNCDRGQSSSDEEPDYMSEEFLKQCTSSDVRPSLLHNRAEKRKHEILKRQHQSNRTKAERDMEMIKSVEEGLRIPINEDNKGYKMLQKMGYKPGCSLGKDNNDPQRRGITTPVEIELRKGRKGLGREKFESKKLDETLGNPDEYRLRQQLAALTRQITQDLKKAQLTCYNLDEESKKTQPLETWFWPKINAKTQKDDIVYDEENEDTNPEALSQIKKSRTDIEDSSSTSSSEEDEEDIPNEHKLETITNYLRSQYSYCLWCGAKYDNKEDLENSCPGETKDDH